MKKKLTFSVLIILLSAASFAQGIYLRAGGGYALPLATASLGEKYLHTNTGNGDTYSTKGVTGSYGAGTNFNLAIGYKFSENFIFEISSQYLMSNKYKTYNNNIYTNSVDNSSTTTSSKAFFFNPSFLFSAGFGKAAPYGRFGLVLGNPKITEKDLSYYNGDGIDSTARKWEYSKGLAFGFQGAIGMNWKLTEKLDFYTEINYISMTYYPGQKNLTQDVSSNGFSTTDNLPNLNLSQKRTVFTKSYDPGAIFDPTHPATALREGSPFSSISAQVGIRFNIWNKSK